MTTITVKRDDLRTTGLAAPGDAPAPGEAAFAVELFALTANNVTYAAHGVDMRYWDFYPAGPDWGVVPVWGFARCTASMVEGVAAGDRFYGYWPMGSLAVLTPVRVAPRGFVDGAPHRGELARVYNGYASATAAMGDERVYALFRPLFLTSFLLDAHFAGLGDTLLIASASSKTALGLAQAAQARGTSRVVGLTSARNRAFVLATGYYDQVATYDEVGALAAAGSVAYADFSGDGGLRAAVHERFGEALVASLIIGDTHWETGGAAARLPGPRPQGFFAPTVLAEQIGALGQVAFDERVEAGWSAFTASTGSWLEIVEIEGLEGARAAWTRLAGGDVDPRQGLIVRP